MIPYRPVLCTLNEDGVSILVTGKDSFHALVVGITQDDYFEVRDQIDAWGLGFVYECVPQ